MTTESTKHFKNCLGVFQGGGCKALAFVGAYSEAYKRGVFFSGVSGTSAGSIIAALVAAGCTPDQLESLVSEVDFKSFKKPAQEGLFAFPRTFLMRLASFHPKGRAALRLGLYSSEYLETWLDEQLRKLTGKKGHSPVTFEELDLPLHVVATQLGSSVPKVWSTRDTPTESVAFAVRCSCSIPLFFQPVNGTYVDGGVVSNLPAFVAEEQRQRRFEKILCFTFDADPPPRPLRSPPKIELSPVQYLEELATAVVDGAVSIQNVLQRNLHTIAMRDLPLSTVDFDKVTAETIQQMFDAGRSSAKLFFDAEPIHVRELTSVRRVLSTKAETQNELARYEINESDEIIILRESNRWVYSLFPTFYYWIQSAGKVTYLRSEAVSPMWNDHERFRDLILAGLGAEVRSAAELPFTGVLVHRNGVPHRGLNFIKTSGRGSPGYAATYDCECDGPALELMLRRALEATKASRCIAPSHDAVVPAFRRDTKDLFDRLRRVRQYAGSEVSFELMDIEADRIAFLTRYVKSYKYTQIRHIFDMAKSISSDVGEDIWLEYVTQARGSFIMPVTPPVVEQHGDRYFLIDGNSRVTFALRELKLSKIRAVVVKGVTSPLPTTGSFTGRQVLISDEDRVGTSRYEEFQYQFYRDIEAAARPLESYLSDGE